MSRNQILITGNYVNRQRSTRQRQALCQARDTALSKTCELPTAEPLTPETRGP